MWALCSVIPGAKIRFKQAYHLNLVWISNFNTCSQHSQKLLHQNEVAPPQGGIISPIRANVYLHYATYPLPEIQFHPGTTHALIGDSPRLRNHPPEKPPVPLFAHPSLFVASMFLKISENDQLLFFPMALIRFPLSFRVVMIQEPQTANLQRKSIVPVSQSVYSMHHNQLPKFD